MYLDCVVTPEMEPVYNSTPENVLAWCREQPNITESELLVVIGKTLRILPIAEYGK